MAKTFFARGSDGVSCIYQGDNTVIDNPQARLQDVLFHSQFRYFKEVVTGSVSVTLPGSSSNSNLNATLVATSHLIASHSLPYNAIPVLWFTGTSEIIPVIKSYTYTPTYANRLIVVKSANNEITIDNFAYSFNYASTPDVTLYISYVLGVIA